MAAGGLKQSKTHHMKALFCLAVVSPILGVTCEFSPSLYGQCDARFATEEAHRLECLIESEKQILEGVFSKSEAPTGDERIIQGLRIASKAYHCILSRNPPEQNYRCFSEVLHERLFSRFEDGDLCFDDRLTRALVALKYLLNRKLPAFEPLAYQAILDRSLSDFRVTYGLIQQIQVKPDDPISLHLAAKWCVDIAAPMLSPAYIQEFVSLSVAIALNYPELANHLGAVLEATLRDAVQVHRATQSEEALKEVHELLVDYGDAFSDLYVFREELNQLLPRVGQPSPPDVEKLLDRSDELRGYLDNGANKPQHMASLYKPFEEYSDVLYDIAKTLQLPGEQRDLKDRSMWESCTVLARGIELSTQYETDAELERVRTKLIDRVRNYGRELARELKYSELIAFESQFLDETERLLTSSQQCHIHAHLAQAFYVLGRNREALQHLEESCGLISPADLNGLREVIEPWLD